MKPGIMFEQFVPFIFLSLYMVACDERYIDVSVSENTIIAVRENGELEAFGCFADVLDLPKGNFRNVDSFSYNYIDGVLENGRIRSWVDGRDGRPSTTSDIPGDYHDVVVTHFAICALDGVDQVQCWKWSDEEQEKVAMDTSLLLRYSFDSLARNSDGACGIVKDGELICFGYCEEDDAIYEQEPVFPEGLRYRLVGESSLNLYETATFAMSTENELFYHYWWWRGNEWVTGHIGPIEDEVVAMSAEADTVCAATNGEELLCWNYPIVFITLARRRQNDLDAAPVGGLRPSRS